MAQRRGRPMLYIGSDGQSHNYIAKLMRFVRRTLFGKRDIHVKVSHDDWCAYFKGRACNCDPNIREMLPWEIPGI